MMTEISAVQFYFFIAPNIHNTHYRVRLYSRGQVNMCCFCVTWI